MIKGLDRLKRKFERLPERAEAEARKAIAASAQEIVEMAKRLAPVDDGALRDSIGWTWGQAPQGSKILGSVRGGAELTATMFAGDDKAFYVRWIEFGTTKMTAQPFFLPSYRASRKGATSRITRAVNKSARAEAAR